MCNFRPQRWRPLPSPQITSTAAASSSSVDPSRQTFRERLVTEVAPKEVATSKQAAVVDANQVFFDGLGKRATIPAAEKAPLFNGIKTDTVKNTQPESESELVTELRDKYAAHGASILRRANTHLDQAQTSLEATLAQMRSADNTLLALVTKSYEKLYRPLASSALQVEATAEDGQARMETVRIGPRVQALGKRLATLEGELAGMWDGWEAAQRDVAAAAQEVLAGGGGEGECAVDMVSALREAVEEELQRLGDEILDEMKGSEQNFKRLIEGEFGAVVQTMLSAPSQYDD